MIDYSFMQGDQQTGQPGMVQPMQQPNIGPVAAVPASGITLQNTGGIADALISGSTNPVAQGNENAGGYMNKMGGKSGASFLLASIGQALSARDPNSWQHQLSGATKNFAQGQLQQRAQLISALQQKMGKAPNVTLKTNKYSVKNSTQPLSLLPAGGGI